jgi:hypothetical protein
LAEMFIGWSFTWFVFLVLIGNPTWLPGPIRTTNAYPWQKLTWPMARWAKNDKDETGIFCWNLKYVLPVYNLAQKGGLSPSGSAYVSLSRDGHLILIGIRSGSFFLK